jgi:predicted RNase H-like HicB family nuclease
MSSTARSVKIIVEKHPDGYVAYPLGFKGVVVGEGDSYEEALADATSAIRFHLDTFGPEVLEADPPLPRIKSSTLRTICTQAGITRDEFLVAFEDL